MPNDSPPDSPPAGPTHHPGFHLPVDPKVEQAFNELAGAAKQAADAVNRRAGRDIFAATAVGVALLAAAVVFLIWLPWGMVVFITVLMVGAQLELAQVLRVQRGWTVLRVPVGLATAVLISASYALEVYQADQVGQILMALVGATVVIIMLVRLRGPIQGYLSDVAATCLVLCYPGLLATALVVMLAEPQGPAKLATFIVAMAATDTGGHLLGVLIGKHPFAPRISPKKSWEGVLGSWLLASATVVAMTVLVLDQAWWKGLILAFCLVWMAIIGDLIESVIKRDAGVKDMGTILPGHGGIMDRLDSYIFAALPAWLLMGWLFPYAVLD
jgi:phosphatidate cytidylyltransferase